MVHDEIELHRNLKHNHVVKFIETLEDVNFIYIIQSLCSNHSLKEFQSNRGSASISECRYFVNQIMLGIDYVHKMGIIHRDLKLANIFIDEKMQVKIGDFGLAIHKDDPRSQSKSICGTISYIAPEVIKRQGFTCRSDIWAIGVITFALHFGYKPFDEHDENVMCQRIAHANYMYGYLYYFFLDF